MLTSFIRHCQMLVGAVRVAHTLLLVLSTCMHSEANPKRRHKTSKGEMPRCEHYDSTGLVKRGQSSDIFRRFEDYMRAEITMPLRFRVSLLEKNSVPCLLSGTALERVSEPGQRATSVTASWRPKDRVGGAARSKGSGLAPLALPQYGSPAGPSCEQVGGMSGLANGREGGRVV